MASEHIGEGRLRRPVPAWIGGAKVRAALSTMAILVLMLGAVGCGQGPSAEKEDTGTEEKNSGSASSAASASSGSASSGSQELPESQIQSSPELEASVDEYRAYVVEQADQLVAGTALFTDAVLAGDVEGARELYAPARALGAYRAGRGNPGGSRPEHRRPRGGRTRRRVEGLPQDRAGPVGR